MAHPAAAATTTRVPVRALSSKVAAGASGSKGMASAKKTTMRQGYWSHGGSVLERILGAIATQSSRSGFDSQNCVKV
jgi:hypothetical protein